MNGNFCSDAFWDLNQTWNSQIPDFSACFQDVVLSTVPSFVFSFIFIVCVWSLKKSSSLGALPLTWLNISKLVLSSCLLIISMWWTGVNIHLKISNSGSFDSSMLSSISRIILFIFNIVIMLRHRTCGVSTSYALSVFWLMYTICSGIQHRSVILKYFIIKSEAASGMLFVINMLFYPIVYLQLFLVLFTDKRKANLLQDTKIIEDISFFSFVTFSWFYQFIHKSRKKILDVCDLGFISVQLIAKIVYSEFSKRWQIDKNINYFKSRSLALNLCFAFWKWLLFAAVLDVLFTAATFVPPLLLDRLINFVEDDTFVWRGAVIVTMMFTVDMLSKIADNVGIFFFFALGCQMKSALMNTVYRKNLLLSTGARKDFTSGAISSLLSVDIGRLAYFTWHCSQLFLSPIKIVIIMIIMWQYIGIATLAGIGVLIALLPVSFYVSRVSNKYTEKQMGLKDIRLKFMNEVLSGIKILKLYAWEVAFSNKITETRRKELKMILNSQFCSVITTFIFSCAPIIVTAASFATFILIDRSNILTPTKAFVTLSLMEELRFAIFDLPRSVAELIECNISLGRLKSFFTAENVDNTVVGNNPKAGESVTIDNGSFSWSSAGDNVLSNINLHVPKGRLIAIIGSVGSGKSSLLSAILGEMYKLNGTVDIKGGVAYVPQQAWVLNRTVKENILMARHMSKDFYNKVLDLCCLRPDLEILPAGDATEIGEKGVNLSGGQKQRVSLARAVYQDKDIYLLDDVLSAVDVHVRKALFEDIIGNQGLLKKKSRILVTHDVSMLHKVDLIVSMKDGKIDEVGTYQELINKNGTFMKFMQEHTSEHDLDENAKENKKVLSRFISTDSAASRNSDDLSTGDHFLKRQKSIPEEDKTFRITDDEKMEVGKVSRTIYWNYFKKMNPPLATVAFFGIAMFVTIETFGNIWLSKWTSEPTVNGTQDISTTIWRLEVYAGQGLGQGIFVVIGNACLMYAANTAARTYHRDMLKSLLKSPMSFFDSTPMGRITNRFSSDLDNLDTELDYLIEGWVNCFLFAIACFFIIGRNTPLFLAALLPIAVIYYILQKVHLHTLRQIRRLESTTKSPLYSQLLESIHGVSSICAYKIEKNFIESFEAKLDDHLVCYLGALACNRWLNFLLDMMGSIILLISSALALQNRKTLTPADVGLMIAYTLNVTNSLKWLVRMSTELEDKSISVERVDEYCHLESEALWELPSDKELTTWPATGKISFENYSARYREELDLVLKEITLSIKGSEKVGIIGRTGAGKSSITMALFRIIEPATGTIFIDDVDITKIGLHLLRSKLTIIPQDPVLFTGSFRSNLDPNNEYSDDELWKSIERSNLKTFASSLEMGLEYDIEESGKNLSAGQRQLVCLARALLKNTKVLVLDEATASVDLETDNLIQNTIRTAFSQTTVITIAHRLNTVLDYDKIVLMDNGRITEVGHPNTLLKDFNSQFYQMAKESRLI